LIDAMHAIAQYASMNRTSPILPPALRPGAVIAVAAPAAAFPRDRFDASVDWLRQRGFQVRFQDDIFDRHHYLAGTARRRLSELQRVLEADDVDAVFFARGGYGVMHLLPDLDLRPLVDRPEILLGYSDLTALFNHVVAATGCVTFHGPLLLDLPRVEDSTIEHVLGGLTTGRVDTLHALVPGCLRPGETTGALCGGSLTLVAATLGTPFELDVRGKILCLEDVGERPYRLDRLFTQLKLAGKLNQAAGIVIGELVRCDEPSGGGRPLDDLLEQVFDGISCPIACNFPFGHGAHNRLLPLGARAVLNASAGTLSFPDPVLTPAASKLC
jgi:muramoyltetrapeptide carboxypeptidase